MTQATANFMAERLGNIEWQAMALAEIDTVITAQELEAISLGFHQWKDGLSAFPERRDLLILIMVIARYLEDGL